MKAVLTNYRYYALALLALVAAAGLMAEPREGLGTAAWLCALALSKAAGFGAAYAARHLAARWKERGSIPELEELLKA